MTCRIAIPDNVVSLAHKRAEVQRAAKVSQMRALSFRAQSALLARDRVLVDADQVQKNLRAVARALCEAGMMPIDLYVSEYGDDL
jgi:hypothetical protein